MVGFGFPLRHATPGWGVGVCVCLCACSACTPPLLAAVCGVGVCAWARVSAVPRHSWLGCRGSCLLVCTLRLHAATPGWGVRRGCVCLDSGFGCAPPLLAGLVGCVCAGVRAPLVPRHSWLVCALCPCVFGLGFRLHPATPGWGVWVCVFVCVLPLYPATPGWGVRLGCVCLGLGLGCAPPLLAVVFGRVCAPVRAPLVPRHFWLGCAEPVWVWVFGLRFRLRPATPGSGVGVCLLVCVLALYPATPGWGVRCGCVCLGSGFGCTPPLLAGVLGCGCAGVPARLVPRLSWLGCAVCLCVFVCALRLYPATPGCSVRCACVCLFARSACTPPLLAGVCDVDVSVWAWLLAAPRHSWLGCSGVPVCVRAPLVPRHCWLGCAAWACVLGLGVRLRHATSRWGVGVCVCWCARSPCTPSLLPGVCGVGVCVWARLLAAPRHSWLGCWAVRICVRAPLVLRHSWLGCVAWACVLGLGVRLRPATSRWGVGVCVCWCARSPCTPPLLPGVCGVVVCVWARVSAAPRHAWPGCCCVHVCVPAPLVPRHSWLGCAAWVCVFGFTFRLRPVTLGWGVGVCVFVCVVFPYPATPGWGVRPACVCLGSGFGRAPPPLVWVLGCACWSACSPCTPSILAGARGVGVRVWVRVLAAPRHSWLGCWGERVLVWALSLYPATPGWDVRCGCMCLGSATGCAPPLPAGVLRCAWWCACSPCTPPLLAGVCGVGVYAWAQVLAAPRHSWLGCRRVRVAVRAPLVPRHSWLGCGAWVCVLGLGFRLRPTSLGWGVGACVCWCARSARSPATPGFGVRCGFFVFGLGCRLRPATLGWDFWVCLLVCVFPLYPASPGWGVGLGCVCLGSCFGCPPPLLAGMLGCVCAGVRASLVPRDSWLGRAACLCVFGLRFRLSPATPGWGVGVCVCWCASSCCTPPLLVAVCVVGVCARPRAFAAPDQSWLGFVVCGLAVGRHLFLCRGWLHVVRAARVCGTWWPLLLSTCPCALVVACSVPLWRASWPRVGAQRLVRSGRSRCSGRPSCRHCAFPHPGGLRPRHYWVAARGTRRLAEKRAHCACRWHPPRQGRWARSASYPFGAPRWGCPWRVPPALVLGCVRCGVLRVWTRSLMRLVSRTARLSTGDSAGAPGLFRVDAQTAPFGSEDSTAGPCACVHVRAFLAASGGPASWARFGAPHPFLWPFLLLSSSARPPQGWGCPACVVSGFCFLLSCAPPLSPAFRVFRPGLPWALGSCGPSPHSLLCLFVFLPPACLFVFFFRVFCPLSFSCCAGCAVPGWCVVSCGACWCVLLWALGFGGGRCALALCYSVPLACASPFCVVACCVECARWRRAGGVALPLAASGVCGLVLPARPLRRLSRVFVLRQLSAGCPPPPPSAAGCAVLCCGLSCFVWCGAAVCGVFCVVSLVVWRACILAPCCAGSCCAVVVVLCFRALLRSLLVCFLRCSLLFRGAPGSFCFCALNMWWCAGVPAWLLSVRCSLAPAALPGVLCCCLLFLRVRCWAWLSSVVSWWVLVVPGVVFRWCAVVCPWVPCCGLFLRVVPPGIVWFHFALFGAVVSSVLSLSVVLSPCAFQRCVLSCFVALCVFCCGVSLRGVVRRCALCRVRPGVLCVLCPLLSVRCCCGALLSLGALLPCAVPRGAVLPCGAVVSRPAALFGLFPAFVWFLLLEKPLQNLFFFENKIKLYTTQRTHTRTLAGSKTMSGSLPYMSPRVGGGVLAGMPWWLRCPGLGAAYVPPAVKGRRKRRGSGTGGRGRYMVNKRGREGRVQGRFSSFTRCSRRSFLDVNGVLDEGRDGVMFLLALRRLQRSYDPEKNPSLSRKLGRMNINTSECPNLS